MNLGERKGNGRNRSKPLKYLARGGIRVGEVLKLNPKDGSDPKLTISKERQRS